MKTKLFDKDEKEAIEKVLDMGCYITNGNDDILRMGGGFDTYYEIMDSYNNVKEYKTISTALTQFLKRG